MEYFAGIDPSFSRTGLALCSVSPGSRMAVEDTAEVSAKDQSWGTDMFRLETTLPAAQYVAKETIRIIKGWKDKYDITKLVVEFPVIATQTGAYLGLIQQALFSYYPWLGVDVVGVPASAISGLVGYKGQNKGPMKDWCVNNFDFNCETKRRGHFINHDRLSGAVLAYIGHLIHQNQYPLSHKTFYTHGKEA